jgi:protein TonB
MKLILSVILVTVFHLGLLNLVLSKKGEGSKVQQQGRRLVVSLKQMVIKPMPKELPLTPKPTQEKLAKTPKKSQQKNENNKVQGIYDQYLMDLSQLLSQKKEYPRLAKKMRIQGQVKVEFNILPNGEFKNIQLVQGSHELLNKAALSLIKDANPFKSFPKGLDKEEIKVSLPISYYLN